MHKLWKYTQDIFCKPFNWRTSKLRLNSTGNSFVFGCKNCENVPRTIFKPCKVKISRMRLNVTGNIFIFQRINREDAPRIFSINLTSREFPKCVWTFLHRSLLYILPVTWERLKSWKYIPGILEKIAKLCFMKFPPVKEIASKFCKCRFWKFLPAGVWKKCCFFSTLREHWLWLIIFVLLCYSDTLVICSMSLW